jgi:hypothetical protein
LAEDVTADGQETTVVIDGITLIVKQTNQSVSVTRVVARDRKRKLDITSGLNFGLADHRGEEALALIRNLKCVARYETARCTCDYAYGFSDHAEHCQSIYVAKYDGGPVDDD